MKMYKRIYGKEKKYKKITTQVANKLNFLNKQKNFQTRTLKMSQYYSDPDIVLFQEYDIDKEDIKKNKKRHKAKMYQREKRQDYVNQISNLQDERDQLFQQLTALQQEVCDLWETEVTLLKKI